ncbi:unnamed protein product [Periconia digitata]|uniref:SGNH hydrolase-type esterase domain-containing protein n=1 Tax=Periconia digitata TaxID=1303443 RepID=A0A9W4XSJ4_9PLEO|nr:unnamed protein product [Periconia digitata]
MKFFESKVSLAAMALSLSYLSNGLSIPSMAGSSDSLSLRDTKQQQCLRIMPLGASITYGKHSTPPNGYRKALRDHLTSLNYNVDMVGSQHSGDFEDNQHEGYPGLRIDQIADKFNASSERDSKPNLFLVNAGTNDCQQNYRDMVGTSERLGDMTELIWKHSEKATIVLSTVLASYNEKKAPGANARVTALNVKIRDLAKSLKSKGRKIVLAEMNDGVLQKSDISEDGIHPTNEGYKKMADVWAKAIASAREQNFLEEPETTTMN